MHAQISMFVILKHKYKKISFTLDNFPSPPNKKQWQFHERRARSRSYCGARQAPKHEQWSCLFQILHETMTALFDLLPDAAAEFLALSVQKAGLEEGGVLFWQQSLLQCLQVELLRSRISFPLKNKLSCPNSVTRQIKSRDLVPHKKHPLLHKAVGKLSVMRQIFKRLEPCHVPSTPHKTGDKPFQIYTNTMNWKGKHCGFSRHKGQKQAILSNWLLGWFITAEMVQYFRNYTLRHNERQYKWDAIPKSPFVSVSKQSRKPLFHFQNMARWFKRPEPQTTLYIFIFQDAALLRVVIL